MNSDFAERDVVSAETFPDSFGTPFHPCGFAEAEWESAVMPQRTERFMFNVDLEALDENRQPIDAVFGLSDGAPSSFSALGPIVRFNPEGRIDVRNGDVYTADVAFPYQSLDPHEDPFDHYHIRMDVDLPSRHYSVWATAPGAAEVEIASNYAFRTEQSALSRIDHVGTFRDSPNGAGFYCGARFSPPVCARSSAGAGFAGQAFPARTGSFYTEFTATPIAAPIDAVVGLSQGAPSAFSDLAAIVRFNPQGSVDARDGDVYRASEPLTYQAGVTYDVFIQVDLATGRYSASVTDPVSGNSPVIANQFLLRTEQAGVTSLDTVGQEVDSASGSLVVCDLSEDRFP